MKELSEKERRILLDGGTEAPFSGAYVDNHDSGAYHCVRCGALLFSSEAKFDSGSGWPAFSNPAVAETVGLRMDPDGLRTEAFCRTCGGHLGHVFDDGPKERGGKRYCINSICLDFDPS